MDWGRVLYPDGEVKRLKLVPAKHVANIIRSTNLLKTNWNVGIIHFISRYGNQLRAILAQEELNQAATRSFKMVMQAYKWHPIPCIDTFLLSGVLLHSLLFHRFFMLHFPFFLFRPWKTISLYEIRNFSQDRGELINYDNSCAMSCTYLLERLETFERQVNCPFLGE